MLDYIDVLHFNNIKAAMVIAHWCVFNYFVQFVSENRQHHQKFASLLLLPSMRWQEYTYTSFPSFIYVFPFYFLNIKSFFTIFFPSTSALSSKQGLRLCTWFPFFIQGKGFLKCQLHLFSKWFWLLCILFPYMNICKNKFKSYLFWLIKNTKPRKEC